MTFAGHVMVQTAAHVVAQVDADAVIVTCQPPEILPTSPAVSSTTKSRQLPLGAVPLKTESVDPYGPAGAGAANVSPPPMFVGLNVPDTIWVPSGRLGAAASSNVIETLLMAELPPVSEARITD